MKLTQEKVLLHLNGNPEWADLKTETAEKLVQEFPYFAPAQFLLAAKLYRDNHPLANDQASKTVLYFNNPLFLQYQLNGLREPGIDQAPASSLDTELLRSIHQKDKEWDALIAETQAPPRPQEPIVIPTIESVRAMMQGIHGKTEEGAPVETATGDSAEEAAHLGAIPVETSPAEAPLAEAPAAAASADTEPLEWVLPPRPSALPSEPPAEANNSFYTPVEAPSLPTSPEQEKSDSKIANLVSAQLAAFQKPLAADASLDIDVPEKTLHTVDYFGSQGIFLDLTKIPQDRLTTQLRKFTDWLKDMKSHNPQAIDLGTSPESEKAVAETALVSNESKEILTETMAEVLAKQGQLDKAIQLYIKLSFSNPEKSAYFAAKIEQLKGI